MAVKPVVIPLTTGAGTALGIIKNVVLVSGKIVLLPGITAVPVIKRRWHFVSAMMSIFYPLFKRVFFFLVFFPFAFIKLLVFFLYTLNHFWENFLI